MGGSGGDGEGGGGEGGGGGFGFGGGGGGGVAGGGVPRALGARLAHSVKPLKVPIPSDRHRIVLPARSCMPMPVPANSADSAAATVAGQRSG